MRGPEPPRGRMIPGPGPFPEPMDMLPGRGPPPPDMMRRGPPPPEAMRRGPPPLMENGRGGSGPLPGPYGPGPAPGGGGSGSRRGRGGGGGAPGPAAAPQQQQPPPRTPDKVRSLKVVDLSPARLAELAKNPSESCFFYEDPQVRASSLQSLQLAETEKGLFRALLELQLWLRRLGAPLAMYRREVQQSGCTIAGNDCRRVARSLTPC